MNVPGKVSREIEFRLRASNSALLTRANQRRVLAKTVNKVSFLKDHCGLQSRVVNEPRGARMVAEDQ